jgi:hypothetical protein
VDRERVDIAVKPADVDGIVSYGWRGPDYIFRFESPYPPSGSHIESVKVPVGATEIDHSSGAGGR